MKNIIKGKDDLYYSLNIKDANGEPLLPSELHAFTMQFYTQNDGTFVEFTKDSLVDNVLRVNASALSVLQDGPLKVRFLIGISDTDYEDNSYDITCERLTGYWLKTQKITQDPPLIIEPVNNENDTEGGAS